MTQIVTYYSDVFFIEESLSNLLAGTNDAIQP